MEKKKIIHASNTLVFESILVINVREGDDLKSLIYRDCKIPTLQAGIRAESAIWNASQAAISPFSQCVLLPRCNEYAFEEFRLIETSPTFVAREKKRNLSFLSHEKKKKETSERKIEGETVAPLVSWCKESWVIRYLLGMILLGRGDPEQGQILGRGGELDGCSDGPAPGVLVIPPARVRITRLAGLADQFPPLNPDLPVWERLLQREEPPPRLGHPVQKGPGVRRHGRRLEVDQNLLVVQFVRSSPALGLWGNKKENSFSLLPCSRWFADPLFFFEREGTILPGYRTLPSRTSTSKLLGQSTLTLRQKNRN